MAGKAKLVTLADIAVTSAGTRKQISTSAIPASTVVFQGKSSNVGSVFVGDSSVAAGQGIEIQKGGTFSLSGDMLSRAGIEMFLLNDLYVDAANSGDVVKVSYINR